jgi:hypothetical protein
VSSLVYCRTVKLLESSAALQEEDRRCDGAGDAYIALARYLPLERTAAAALNLLTDSKKRSPWRAEHGVRVAAGLLRHKAVRDKPLASLGLPQLSGGNLLRTMHAHLLLHAAHFPHCTMEG